MFPLTEGVKILLILMGGVFGLEWILRADWSLFGLVPILVWRGHVYELVTYIFLHGGFWHLLMNAMGLFFFGPALEDRWGTGKFLGFFIGAGVAGGVLATLLEPNSMIPIIGASGAVYGVLAASAMIFPNSVIYLYMIIPVRAKWLVIFLAGYEFFSLFRGGVGISHEAHLGGMAAGALFVLFSEQFLGYRFKRWMKKRQYERDWDRREQERLRNASLQREVDGLLDKINREGLNSLSTSEKNRLEEASRKLREK